ncbi:MAG: RNA-binding domain-containing protein [Nanopusillaceae archaeon]
MKISEIKFSVIIHEWENYEKIKQKFLELLDGINKEKIEIYENKGQGLISSNIYFISAKIKDKNSIKIFLKNILKRLDSINRFLEEINFDENCNVYIRFDKEALLKENRIFPMYGENVFHLKISIDSYKKDKESVKKFLNEFFNSLKNL